MNSNLHAVFTKNPDRRDHIHSASVGEILSTGWVPYFAPLQLEGKILHARLVFADTIKYGADPTLKNAIHLASVFKKVA